MLFDGAALTVLGVTASKIGLIVITLERYFKIVKPWDRVLEDRPLPRGHPEDEKKSFSPKGPGLALVSSSIGLDVTGKLLSF